MKVFRVTTERDGPTTRVEGRTSIELMQEHYHFVADSLANVWTAIRWLRDDAERDVVAIIEVLPAVTILHGDIDVPPAHPPQSAA